ncbi:MAG TPA: hypothetical protein VMV27_13210 [Candidatus Binataceae bacterium]|nr:hypothetical protein [Candidatus Binataceae bacterium]
MKPAGGKLAMRRWLRAAALLIALFVIGAVGAMLFMRMRRNLEIAAQSPLEAVHQAAPQSSAASSNTLAANTMSGASEPSQQVPVPVPMRSASPPPPPAQNNELNIPQQPSAESSSALTLPGQSMLDAARSRGATDYLHSHRLPFVTAKVFSGASGAPAFLMLSGEVATEFGRQDAEHKVREFLGTPGLALDNQIKVEPNVATREIPPGMQNPVLKLPSVFKGCWELVSDVQDGPVHLLPGARTGCVYTHDSGRFCYQRGAGGDYLPSFSSLRLAPGLYGRQSDEWSRLELVSTDGVDSMRMRFLLHHGESASVIPFLFSANEAIDETHEFSCRVAGDTMHCEDHEPGRLGGQPWCDATHIDEFRRVVN